MRRFTILVLRRCPIDQGRRRTWDITKTTRMLVEKPNWSTGHLRDPGTDARMILTLLLNILGVYSIHIGQIKVQWEDL